MPRSTKEQRTRKHKKREYLALELRELCDAMRGHNVHIEQAIVLLAEGLVIALEAINERK